MKKLIFLFLLLFTFGCSQFNPYIDSRREAGVIGTIGPSTKDKVSICYNSLQAKPEQIISMAESECAKTGRTPEFYQQKYWDCSLFTPTRVEYLCRQTAKTGIDFSQ